MQIKSVLLFDTAGKQIFGKTNLGSNKLYTFPTSGISDEIYIVKVVTQDNRSFAQKITVYNHKS